MEIELETDDGERSVEVEFTWQASDEERDVTDVGSPDAVDTGDAVLGPATPPESLARFEVFRDKADEWRWRLVHRNGT
jgi:hypothetical protein